MIEFILNVAAYATIPITISLLILIIGAGFGGESFGECFFRGCFVALVIAGVIMVLFGYYWASTHLSGG